MTEKSSRFLIVNLLNTSLEIIMFEPYKSINASIFVLIFSDWAVIAKLKEF